ncbi:helix-turn-helix domain-containing protein [Pseudomonas savastanoi]|uniref:helix-turn-helix domain-containing protein n=1 Tax=Pseudomonas savastanoi TaxID=29438 RepID=UPI00177BC0D8|nr:DNA-binding protein [Pseudomonas savastanoi]
MTLVSISKAAQMLGIGRTTAYKLAKEGRLPCVRSLGPLRIHAEKLQKIIDAEADASLSHPQYKGNCEPNDNLTSTTDSRSTLRADASRKLNQLLAPRGRE